jgi:hypothetical protein
MSMKADSVIWLLCAMLLPAAWAQNAPPSATPAAAPTAKPAEGGQKPAPPADATQNRANDDDTITKIIKVVNEVNVIFTVTDKHGHYVKDLKKNDFRVLDDAKPAVEVSSFHRETDLPLQVGLLVDASNSVWDRFNVEEEASSELLN